MDFPSKLKILREMLGINQTELGKIVGLNQGVISFLEQGKSNPSKTLKKYLEYRWPDIFGEGAQDDLEPNKKVPHSIVIHKFQQKDLAWDINFKLLKLEDINPDALEEVKQFIQFKIGTYDRRIRERREEDRPTYDKKERRSDTDRRRASGED